MDARPNTKPEGIGARVMRKEDARFITGGGRFVDDIALPNTLYAKVLRSPVAHGRIIGIDVSRALAMGNDIVCLTAADIPELKIPIRIGATPELTRYLQQPLARDIVRFVGEPVVVVLANSLYRAEDALEIITLQIEELRPVLDPSDAMSPDSPSLHAGAPNVAQAWTVAKGDVEKALADAPVIVEGTFETARHSGVPMELRGLLAAYDAAREVLQVWGPTKLIHVNRLMLSQMLDRNEESIQFIEPDVGGGFGVRGEFYPEDYLIPLLALRTGRPIKWSETRQEHFLSINHSREQKWRIRIAARDDGKLLAVDADLINDMGAYIRTHGTIVPHHSCTSLPGPYFLENYRCSVTCTMSNKTPTGTMRAPGMFEATFVRERAMDLLAERLGLPVDEIRRRNLITPEQLPYLIYPDHGTYRPVYDNGDFPYVFEACLDVSGFRDRPAERDRSGRLLKGIGLAAGVEPSGLGPFERARLKIDTQGKLNVYVGATQQGQGLETSLAQICVEVFEIPIDDVRIRHGDTNWLSFAYGTNASRSAVLSGNAVYKGALELMARVKVAGAAYLNADPDTLIYEAGYVYASHAASRRVSLGELARATSPFAILLKSPLLLKDFSGQGLEVISHVSNVPEGTCVFSVHVAEVTVDRETGVVTIDKYFVGCDIGRALNPMIVEGQLAGGVVQGLGGALSERLVYDEAGQLVTGSFMDYGMPKASQSPPIDMFVLERVRSKTNELGVKGVGEVGTSGAGAAIANAVADALKGTGIEINALPISAELIAMRAHA